MRTICIHSDNNERPFRGVAFVDANQSPDDALQSWINNQWGEDLKEEYIQKMNLEYFFVDPLIGFFVGKVEDDAGNDGEGDVANNLRYRLCRMAEISPEAFVLPRDIFDVIIATRFNL